MSMSQCLRQSQRPGIVLSSMRRDEDDRSVMLEAFGALYAAGFPNDWARLYPTGGHVVPLPAYAWQRERFWVEDSGQAPVAPPARRAGTRCSPGTSGRRRIRARISGRPI
jgi:acyl transferase domain-containing protein